MKKHIHIGQDLILKVDEIVSAVKTTDDQDRPCIKITLIGGTTWTVWANLNATWTELCNLTDNLYLNTLLSIKEEIESKSYRKSKLEQRHLERLNKLI